VFTSSISEPSSAQIENVRILNFLLEILYPSRETVTLTEFKTGERGHMAIIIQETNTEGEGDPYYEVGKSQISSEFSIFNIYFAPFYENISTNVIRKSFFFET